MTHFLRAGHGPDNALLLHCMLGYARSLDGVMAKLADRLSMLSMDLPGHGQSENWDKTRDYAEMACDMAFGLLDQPAHLIGHSYGAYLVLRMAVERPEMVRSLTLIEPVFFAAAKADFPDEYRAYEKSSAAFMGAIAAGDQVSAARAFTADWGDGRHWESLKPEGMEYVTDRMPLIAATGASIVEDSGDVIARLGEIGVPCLLLEGAASPKIMSCVLSGLEARISETRRRTIEDAAHMVPLTHPDLVATEIRDFLPA